jgi:hypothetical protein
MNPNPDWFKARFAALGVSLRGMAHSVDVSPAIASRLINGVNEWTVDYMLRFAKAMGVSLHDFLADGLRVDPKKYRAVLEPMAPRYAARISNRVTIDSEPCVVHEGAALYGSAPVVGVINDTLDASEAEDVNVPLVDAPLSKKFDVFRLHSLGPFDGTLFFVGESQPPEECVNRLCLVRGRSRSSLRIVRKGSAGSTFDLVNPRDPMDREVNAKLEAARQVKWIRTAA